MLLQNFNFCMADPNYELQIQQTLTVKPKDLFMHAALREGIDIHVLEERLQGGSASSAKSKNGAEIMKSQTGGSQKAMSVFYGGNMGTCEALAQIVVNAACNHGYKAQAQPLDEATDNLPTDQPVLIISSSYEGQPPDNACRFVEWVKCLEKSSLAGVSYAVFGCGNSESRLENPLPLL